MEPATCGTGAMIALNALGLQNTVLSNLEYSPETSMFTPIERSPTQFIRSYRCYKEINSNAIPNWPFDQFFTFTLKPKMMGDLLTNVFLKITLPAISPAASWGPQPGIGLLKSAQFYVGSTLVEEIDSYIWNYTLMNVTTAAAAAYPAITKKNDVSSVPYYKYGTLALYLPLPFWFSRVFYRQNAQEDSDTDKMYRDSVDTNFNSYFPVCSVYNQELYIKLQFNSLSFISSATSISTVPEFSIVTEEISLSDTERLFWRNSKFSQLIRINQKLAQYNTSSLNDILNAGTATDKTPGLFKYKVSSTIPVKTLIWFFINRKYIEKSNEYLNRYNTSSTTYRFNTVKNSLISAIELQKNTQTISFITDSRNDSVASSLYFLCIDKYESGINIPLSPIFTYSFDVSSSLYEDSGSTNYSIMNKTDTYTLINYFVNDVTLLSEIYTFFCYCRGYLVLDFQNGYMNVRS